MATKLQLISQLTYATMKKLTHTIDDWLNFLNCAAWHYKYTWHEQVMIYAQRPNAKACASMEVWNKIFKRWVNKGSKGIVLFNDANDFYSLRYVFDVSDTNTRYNIPFELWQLKEG